MLKIEIVGKHGIVFLSTMPDKEFKSGSKGAFVSGNVALPDGEGLTAELKDANTNETLFLANVPAKEFSTGSKGYFANGKGNMRGVDYQVQVQLIARNSKVGKWDGRSFTVQAQAVIIGSAPASVAKAEAKAIALDAAADKAKARADALRAELAAIKAAA